ncbi:MAG: hypothetical protein KA508_01585 [Gammaproteobacteria bacterium]|nr:hypothetical protein [Gammaproteobacteria bacterium]
MKLGELKKLMVQVEGVLLQNPIDPITEGSVLDPVVIAAEKVLKEKRIYDRTTLEKIIKLGQGDPLRMLEDQRGQPRLLARSDIETVFSVANVALILIRNIVSNNLAIFDS